MEFTALNTNSVPTLVDFTTALPFITIQRIHAVHKGYAEASQWMLIACLVGAELERRKGNHRIVAVGATSRDMGTE